MPDEFIEKIVAEHNKRRKLHNSPELRYSDELAAMAQEWSERLAKQAHISYYEKCGIGENITFFPLNLDPESIVEYWYEEHVKYEYETPGWQAGTNFFTQVIWKATEEIGIGRSVVHYPESTSTLGSPVENGCSTPKALRRHISPPDEQVIVAFYRPAGNSNRAGQFVVNVHKPAVNNHS